MTAKNTVEHNIDARVAVLAQTYANIFQYLGHIDRGLGEIRLSISDLHEDIKKARKEAQSDFRWLLTIIGGLGLVMAYGFHWF